MKFILIVISLSLILNFISSSSNQFDLSVEWVRVEKETVGEGEIIEISAKIENENADVSRAFAVSFYYDETDEEHLIGRVFYESINYYRIPSIKFDTKNKEGFHKIIVHVSDENEENNYAFCNITIFPTKKNEKVMIDEIYYHARPHRKNEYVRIVNAGNEEVNLSGWYITTQPWKRADKQNKIIFPFVNIKPSEKIYVTQNATSFKKETGFEPDFEYYNCSSIPDMERKGSFIMSNKGGAVCLKDEYNHTVDIVIYGESNYKEKWVGKPVENVKEGVVLKRKDLQDTNTSIDWEYNRTFIIGQSNFKAWHGKVDKATAFCSPDCSYDIISQELKNAEKILINVYIFTNPFIAKILNNSNSEIKLFLDGNVIGGIPMEERWIAFMLSKKGEVRYMIEDKENGIYKRYTYNHAKYVICDNKCIIQSANFAKSGVPVDTTYGNREWGIVVESENLSSFLTQVFEYDWNPSFQDSILFNEESFTHGKPPSDFFISYSIPEGNYIPAFSPFYLNSTFNATLILSPDNAEEYIMKMIDEAENEILVEQAYIQKDWSKGINPFLRKLIEKNESGVSVKVILNYNPRYESTSSMNKETLNFLKERKISAKLKECLEIHNKGMIVDGSKVLISSINWGENSVRKNREIGIIVESEEIASYFEKIFWYDWNYECDSNKKTNESPVFLSIIATFLIIYLYRRQWI